MAVNLRSDNVVSFDRKRLGQRLAWFRAPLNDQIVVMDYGILGAAIAWHLPACSGRVTARPNHDRIGGQVIRGRFGGLASNPGRKARQ